MFSRIFEFLVRTLLKSSVRLDFLKPVVFICNLDTKILDQAPGQKRKKMSEAMDKEKEFQLPSSGRVNRKEFFQGFES